MVRVAFEHLREAVAELLHLREIVVAEPLEHLADVSVGARVVDVALVRLERLRFSMKDGDEVVRQIVDPEATVFLAGHAGTLPVFARA